MKILLLFLMVLVVSFLPSVQAKDYIIYSISQDLPMGDGKKVKKNFYVNIGKDQGVKKGILLSVYRLVSKSDPYNNNARYNHQVKIGHLEILHSEKHSSITALKKSKSDTPYKLDIYHPMIGDRVILEVVEGHEE